jgi:hypothetical protein
MRREPLLVTDVDRIGAARLAAARLRELLDATYGPFGRWDNYIDSAGGVISEVSKRPLSERHSPQTFASSEVSKTSVATLPVSARRKRRTAA